MKIGKTLDERTIAKYEFIRKECGVENKRKVFALFPTFCEITRRHVWLESVWEVKKYNHNWDRVEIEYYELESLL